MHRLYRYSRLTGYVLGLAGAGLMVRGRMGSEPSLKAGGVLLIAAFVAFLISYALYMFLILRRRCK